MHAARVVELPVDVLISVLWRGNPGEPHAILTGGEEYVSLRFEQDADRELRAALARAGITERRLRDVARVIQLADAEFYGWVQTPAEDYAVLVAARGRDAVTLVRRGDMVTLATADPDRLAQELVSLLPGVPPERGPSISVRAADLRSSNPGGFLRQAAAARPLDARRLDELLRRPRVGWAQLYAAVRDHTGARRRSADSLNVLDAAGQGRWLIYLTEAAGARAVNAVPGSPARFAGTLAALRRSAARGARQ